ncbi:MAG: acetoin utilization protein AcuB [Planctomycetota bacterium]|jgi:acetoin utilization protein AcuB
MRKNTPVREWMSRLPIEIEETTTIAEAHEIMESENVRHFPVMRGSHLVGLVSLHDLDMARAAGSHDRAVSELGPREVLKVSPTDVVPDVCRRMHDAGVGSAVVVDGDVVVGIFTASDAVRFLASG